MVASSQRESFVRVCTRRAISWTGLSLSVALIWSLLPLWLVAALAFDTIRERRLLRRAATTRALLLFATYLACELLGVVAAVVVGAVTLFSSARTRIVANAALQRAWTGVLFDAIRFFFGMSLVVEGADLAVPAPFLLLVRHSSTADTLLAAAIIANPHRFVLRYVLKRELLWDPCLDIVGRRLANAFVDRSGASTEQQLEAIGALADGLDERTGVLIYPEGTRFSVRKRDAAAARLEAAGKTELAAMARGFSHVLAPQLGGPLTLLERMRGVDVVFVDQHGLEGAASLATLARGALVHGRIDVRLRRIAAADVPHDGLDVWLFRQWAETDAWVAARERERARVAAA